MRPMSLLPPFEFKFDERKATQAAARFLKLRGGKMSHLKLIKLLYLMDREALKRWGRPVTGDSYVSMPQGPVLSKTYELMAFGGKTWKEIVSEIGNYEVSLKGEPSTDDLSEAEIELIDEIFKEYGGLGRWKLRDLTHEFQEWTDPGQSSIPILIENLLKILGKTEAEISKIKADEMSLRRVESILDRA